MMFAVRASGNAGAVIRLHPSNWSDETLGKLPVPDWDVVTVDEGEGPVPCAIVPSDHPYALNFHPEVTKRGPRRWFVRWRDFEGHKHDADFPTRRAAIQFARLLRIGPHLARDSENVAANDRTWRAVFGEPPPPPVLVPYMPDRRAA